jgi:hypothetical protein
MARKSELDRVREVCLALPEVTERLSHGSPTFFVRKAPSFLMFHDDHHGDGVLGVWCAAGDGVQGALIEANPDQFFRPAYVGSRGWIGIRLDRGPDWDEVAELIEDAYRVVAPVKLTALLDAE